MKKFILLALIGALVLPLATRAESGSGSSGSPSLINQFKVNKVKLSDDKGLEQRGRLAEGELMRNLGNPTTTRPLPGMMMNRGEDKLDLVKEFRAKQQEKRGTRIQNYTELATKRLSDAVSKLENVATRVDSLIGKWAASGISTDNVKIQLETLKAKTATAKSAVEGLPKELAALNTTDTLTVAQAQQIRTIVQKVVVSVKEAGLEMQKLMVLVHQTLASNATSAKTSDN